MISQLTHNLSVCLQQALAESRVMEQEKEKLVTALAEEKVRYDQLSEEHEGLKERLADVEAAR